MNKLTLDVKVKPDWAPDKLAPSTLALELETAQALVLELVQQIVEHGDYKPGPWSSKVIQELV